MGRNDLLAEGARPARVRDLSLVLLQWHLPSHPQARCWPVNRKTRSVGPFLVAELDGPFAFNRYEEACVAIWANSSPMW